MVISIGNVHATDLTRIGDQFGDRARNWGDGHWMGVARVTGIVDRKLRLMERLVVVLVKRRVERRFQYSKH